MAADWLGGASELLPATRDQAMRVPAVVAARNIICTTLAEGALRAFKNEELLRSQPAWLSRTDSTLPPQMRLLWTFDDLLFSGFSLWGVLRSGDGRVIDAERIPPERWSFDDEYVIHVDEQPVDAEDVILFTGWDEGLLITGSDEIRGALDLARMVRTRVKNPTPVTVIQPTDSSVDLTDGSEDEEDNEQRDLVEGYIKARSDPRTGGVMFLPPGLSVEDRGGDGLNLMESGRNAAVLDFARLTGVPAQMLEATSAAASLTYQTEQSNRTILGDRLRSRALVVEARLSMDDVTPRGTRIALDLSHLIGPDTGLPTPTED